jgi:O-antigen/teichoic acid export membrane protein
MSALSRLLRQSGHYFGGRVGLMLLGLISFPLFTRLYSLADYGVINLVIKLVLMLTALSKLGLQNSISRFYKTSALSSDHNALPIYFSSIFFGSLAVSATFAAALATAVAVSPPWLISAALRPPLLLGSVLLFTGTLRSIIINFMRAQERTRLYNALEIITKAIGIVAACALCFTWGATATSFLGAMILSEVVGLTLLVVPAARSGMISWQHWQYQFFRKALIFGAPLVGLEVGNLLLDSGDRLLIARFLGTEALGLYSAASNVAGYVQDLLMAPVLLAVFPIYMNLWIANGPEETRKFLSRTLQAFLCVAIGLVAIITPTAEPAMMLLASPKFAPAASLVPVLAAGLIVFATVPFYTAGLYLHNQTATIAMTTVTAAALNFGCNALLLPRFGLMGGAVASIIGYACLLAVTAYFSQRHFKLDLHAVAVVRSATAGALAMIPAVFIKTGTPAVDLAVRGSVTAVIYAALLYAGDHRVRHTSRLLAQRLRSYTQDSCTLSVGGQT